MTRHYPLDQDLDFERYEHRQLEVRDILLNRTWELLVAPISPDRHGVPVEQIWDASEPLEDLRFMVKTFEDFSLDKFTHKDYIPLSRANAQDVHGSYGEWPVSNADVYFRYRGEAITAARMFLFQVTDPDIRYFFEQLGRAVSIERTYAPRLRDLINKYKKSVRVQDAHPLFSVGFPKVAGNSLLSHTKTFRASIVKEASKDEQAATGTVRTTSFWSQGTPDRASSVPTSGSWTSACYFLGEENFLGHRLPRGQYHGHDLIRLVFEFPSRRVSELDKFVRRRSLSRSHIRNMFKDPPPRPSVKTAAGSHPCSNCGDFTHKFKKCPNPCGHCGKKTHQAVKCPVKPSNRCKCMPFPEHTAAECPEPCSRPCGNPFPFRHNKHQNAMSCTSRCCMCGIKGHSGKQCKFKRCQCGKQHLTQGCRWKVECPAARCDRYLCNLHCAGCGKKRDRQFPFTGGRCQECLEDCEPVRPRA